VIVIGMGLAIGGYIITLYGFLLVTGKNVSFAQLFGSTWPPNPATTTGAAKAAA
jgi:hypothetical protein